MPLVKIYVPAGKRNAQFDAIGEVVHRALVDVAKAPAEGKFQLFVELPEGSFRQPREYKGIPKSDDFILVEMTVNAGRSPEVKAALYRAIAEGLARETGISSNDVIISLVEVTKENWSFGGGVSTYAGA